MTTTRYPASTSLREMPRPKPRLPPVTMILRIVAHYLSSRTDGESRDKVQRRRNHVTRESLPAEPQNLILEFTTLLISVHVSVQNHIGHDQRTCNRTT